MPTFNDIPAVLTQRFPQLAEIMHREHDSITDLDGNYLCYVIFGDVLKPQIKKSIQQNDDGFLKAVFIFFEEVSVWDEASATLIHVEIGEWLLNEPGDRESLYPFLGAFVINAIKSIEDWNRNYQMKQKGSSTC